jgi:hypothetical protein
MEMKVLLVVGLLVLVLGIVSLFVAFPHTENHGINAGPISANVQTKDHEKLPPALTAVLIIGGAGMAVMGARARA